MRYPVIVLAAFASLASPAWAQNTASPRLVSREAVAQADAATMSHDLATHYVRNANNCAPDRARPVWSARQTLLGYACYDNPNGM